APAVLEPDDAWVAGQLGDGPRRENGVVALVEDQVEGAAVGQGPVVREEPGLATVGEVGGQDEEAVGPGSGSRRGVRRGQGRSVAGTGDDRDPATGLSHRDLDERGVLVESEGDELAGTAGGEDRRRAGR